MLSPAGCRLCQTYRVTGNVREVELHPYAFSLSLFSFDVPCFVLRVHGLRTYWMYVLACRMGRLSLFSLCSLRSAPRRRQTQYTLSYVCCLL